ncbi:MAG: hypothetical protein D6725_12415 [Planctomycetota bacterium]|nr:MAG: hypothetical protein D6725_12415 [Planctomycetota bacterium]
MHTRFTQTATQEVTMFDATMLQRGSDVRGEYPLQVNEELAFAVGRYLVRYVRSAEGGLDAVRILVGRDGRTSSFNLYAALAQGIAAAGGVPVLSGLATTDMIQWGVGERIDGVVAGAMITASHNPPEYNGIKMFRAAGDQLEPIRPKAHLWDVYQQDTAEGVAAETSRVPFSRGARLGLQDRFVRAACQRAPSLSKASGKVVFDPGNGVAGVFLQPLKAYLAEVGASVEIEAIAARIDGTFPSRPANPGLPGAMRALEQKVRELGASFGAAFDGDADRVFIADETGHAVSGSHMLAALAARALELHRARGQRAGDRPRIVFAATASWLVVDAIRAHGGQPVICRVGQDTAKFALQATGAIFGGEASAHYNFPDTFCLDSGLFALMMFWEALLESGQSCSQWLSRFHPWPNSGEINLRIETDRWKDISAAIIATLRDRYSATEENCHVMTLDGVSVYHPRSDGWQAAAGEGDSTGIAAVFRPDPERDPAGERFRYVQDGYDPQWWFNVRASNNEPLLRVNFETRNADELLPRCRSLLDAIGGICREQGVSYRIQDYGNFEPAALR